MVEICVAPSPASKSVVQSEASYVLNGPAVEAVCVEPFIAVFTRTVQTKLPLLSHSELVFTQVKAHPNY